MPQTAVRFWKGRQTEACLIILKGIRRGDQLEYVQMIQRSPSANPAALVRVISGKNSHRDIAPRGGRTREHRYSGIAPAG